MINQFIDLLYSKLILFLMDEKTKKVHEKTNSNQAGIFFPCLIIF
jgi:hypothetical protein